MTKKNDWDNRIRVCFCFLILAVFSLPVVFAAADTGKGENSKSNLEEITKNVKDWMKAGDIPGLTLVIIRPDTPDYIKGFGYADLESKTPVTPDTLFELGSCSKGFTALAALLLEEKGLLNLDAPITGYLPWFYATYQNQRPTITTRQLLHHTSGIPWESFSLIPRESNEGALQKTVRKLVGIRLNHLPGQGFQYAAINYDIVGLIIEKVTGKAFEEYMAENIFSALNLPNTSVGVRHIPMMATGYKRSFFKPRKYTPPLLRGNNPGAYIITSGTDLARWLKIQVGLVDTGFNDLIQESHQPDITVDPGQNLASYGMGWFISQFRDNRIFHSGLNPNFATYITFKPAEKIGVAVMINSDSNFASFIGNAVLDLFSGQELPRNYPAANKTDVYCSIFSLILGLYILLMAALVIIKISGLFLGRSRYSPFTREKVLRILRPLLASVPFLVGIYIIPHAIARVNWETALFWQPYSFRVLIVLLLFSLAVTFFYHILSMIIPHNNKYRNEIPIIVVISILSGLANTAMLFIITTAFFSTIAMGYLLYYYVLVIMLSVGGAKIVETKLINISNNIALDLRIDLINKIFSTRYQHFEKIQDGRIFTTVNGDTGVLSNSAGMLVGFVTSMITAISAFLYMVTISPLATLVVVATVSFLIVYFRLVAKKSRVDMEEARDIANVYMSLLNGLIKGYKELSIHRRKKYEFREDLIDSTQKFCDKSVMASIKFLNAGLLGNSVSMVILGILSIVISRVVKGVNMITLISFVMVLFYLLGPLRQILGAIPQLTGLKVAWNRIKEFVRDLDVDGKKDPVKEFIKNLDRAKKEEIIDFNEIRDLPKLILNLKAEGLCYQYKSTAENGEKGFAVGPIDFEIDSGEILFVIGGNGSGKTTLAKLLTGLYKPDQGTVSINGISFAENKLGEFFSTIFSNYHLFKKLYNVDISNKKNDIRELLEILRLDTKVEVKDGEYSTLDLSGGQRKRLALFQCYLEDRPIYLFDEMAADQDPAFRKFFYRELLVNIKKQGKIVIAITHDDHYFDVADKIIKLDMGKIDNTMKGEDLYTTTAKIGKAAPETAADNLEPRQATGDKKMIRKEIL